MYMKKKYVELQVKLYDSFKTTFKITCLLGILSFVFENEIGFISLLAQELN